MTVEFRLLGAVEMYVDGVLADLGHTRQASVLAVLLVEAGRPVPVSVLLERVYAGDLPRNPRGALHGYLSRLRRIVPGFSIARHHDSYELRGDPLSVDLHRFHDLVARARRERNPDLFSAALDLWRGEAFSGLDTPWFTALREDLANARFAAELDRNDLLLSAGRHAEVLGELEYAVAVHPSDERLAVQYINALHASGRRADAVRHYEQLRERLNDELGADPRPSTREAHQRIIGAAVPRQLPSTTPHFVGRQDELAALDRIGGGLAVIHGSPGSGKTTLALQWAHRVRERFPDGQLFANLRGYDPDTDAGAPDVLRGFLTALGVQPDQVPVERAEQAALYQELLTDRNVLVLLDNARDSAHVRPLLPASTGSMVLVTSRHRLAGEGVALRPFSREEARDLLERRLGRERVQAEPEAAEQLVHRSGRLPLALAVLVARAAVDDAFPLRALADDLADEHQRLDVLDGGDERTSVRATISWSYHGLPVAQQRVLRLLSLHPGPDVSARAVSALTGSTAAALVSASLLTEHRPGRFAMHDLIRAYALEEVTAADLAVRQRMFDHYLDMARAAALLARPTRDDLAPSSDTTLRDHRDAWAWFEAELPVLRALITQAGSTGFDDHAWRLAWTLGDHLDRSGRWHDWVSVGETALAAARRLGGGEAVAWTERGLGQAHILLRRFDDAQRHLSSSLDQWIALGDRLGEAGVHRDMALMHDAQGAYPDALAHGMHALEIYRLEDHRAGEAAALNQIGWYCCRLGEYERALALCEQSLVLHQKLGHRAGEGVIWDSLGYIHHHLGHHADAVACYSEALAHYEEFGDRFEEAATLSRLADARWALGDSEGAREALRAAVEGFEALGHPDAAPARTKLGRLT